ncbi:hypothetical protein [Tissierella sp.]|uniref:hypothetical protein n=1 Tax=Tissierella sp. TaxID=41274 RepID=UPI002862F314|nr:hypothetical protein [Tissierella sp.]MDR7855174.1 hypothetical protein [Tissierella sp.]
MNEKIMVIEDEKKIADAISYELKKLKESKLNAIILDVMLPSMDRYDMNQGGGINEKYKNDKNYNNAIFTLNS